MAITVTQLVSSSSNLDQSSYSTASITPSSNALVFAQIFNRVGGGTAPVPSVTGNSLTWEQVDTVLVNGNTRMTLFRTMGASPSAGAVTIDYSGATQANTGWKIFELAGVDTSGSNGSGAIVQKVVGSVISTNTPTVTLASFADATNNAGVGVFTAFNKVTTFAPEGTWTEVGTVLTNNSPNTTAGAEYIIGEDTSVTCTFGGTASNSGGIAVEVKAAGGGGGPSLGNSNQFLTLVGVGT